MRRIDLERRRRRARATRGRTRARVGAAVLGDLHDALEIEDGLAEVVASLAEVRRDDRLEALGVRRRIGLGRARTVVRDLDRAAAVIDEVDRDRREVLGRSGELWRDRGERALRAREAVAEHDGRPAGRRRGARGDEYQRLELLAT